MKRIWLLLLCVISSNILRSGSTFYGLDGNFGQVESANRGAMSGKTILAFRSNNHIVVMEAKNRRENGLKQLNPKVTSLSSHICMGIAGLATDCQYLTNKLFEDIENHLYLFNSSPTAERLAKKIANHIHGNTLTDDLRPFAARLCLCGFTSAAMEREKSENRPTLNEDTVKKSDCGGLNSEECASYPVEEMVAKNATENREKKGVTKVSEEKEDVPCIWEVTSAGSVHKCEVSCIGE